MRSERPRLSVASKLSPSPVQRTTERSPAGSVRALAATRSVAPCHGVSRPSRQQGKRARPRTALTLSSGAGRSCSALGRPPAQLPRCPRCERASSHAAQCHLRAPRCSRVRCVLLDGDLFFQRRGERLPAARRAAPKTSTRKVRRTCRGHNFPLGRGHTFPTVAAMIVDRGIVAAMMTTFPERTCALLVRRGVRALARGR